MRWQRRVCLGLLGLSLLWGCGRSAKEPVQPASASPVLGDHSLIVQREPLSPRQQAERQQGVTAVTVTDRGFQPTQVRVVYGTRVKIYLTNRGKSEHNMVIPRFGIVTSPLTQGGDTYIEFTASERGHWPFFSDAPGTPERGLAGELIVE
jgi:FtsP/CotA-like multicopper oxidase with cupredoxin domain